MPVRKMRESIRSSAKSVPCAGNTRSPSPTITGNCSRFSSSTSSFSSSHRASAVLPTASNSTSGAEAHLPFGGNGKSGNGSRQSGVWVLDQFTRWQSMNWDYAGKLQKAQMDVEESTADLGFRL